ncbi:MAG: right-handed parallel beta-helix repeat-containing protein [Pirellulaceae bacterium]|nr:right-handed parallel beta-helix repeat-containing protein [Pirellulaceae bacterium]
MKSMPQFTPLAVATFAILSCLASQRMLAEEKPNLFAPSKDEQQLPFAMHSKMEQLPTIRVGQGGDAAMIGRDNRVLQAAVDYIAALGGGVVEIGPGEYLMRDSLHLRSNVTMRGVKGKTVLQKSPGHVAPLVLDGDFGQQQITVEDPTGFEVGYGVAIWDSRSGGFHTTVARITGRRGNTFAIDKPLMADCMVHNKAQAATVFPVVSGYELRGARVENLVIEGDKENNEYLNGCRGAGIFLYRGYGTIIRDCTVRNYHGDGVSFQQSNDVTVLDCQSHGNTHLGFHPGSGSQRPTVRNCVARDNGTDGLFLCWRVRHGLFEDNLLEGNGRFGISIGHKDTDNLIQKNTVRKNGQDGVFFRKETFGMAAHRNQLKHNVIEDNGANGAAAGIRIRGETDGLVFEGNKIRDTRQGDKRTQTVGVLIEQPVRDVTLRDNKIDAVKRVDDKRDDKRKE